MKTNLVGKLNNVEIQISSTEYRDNKPYVIFFYRYGKGIEIRHGDMQSVEHLSDRLLKLGAVRRPEFYKDSFCIRHDFR